MATLTTDRRTGTVTGYIIQWQENKCRHTISLIGRTYRRKTAERFKEMVETLIYYRKNMTTIPEKSVASWLATIPAALHTKLAAAGLLVVDEPKTCREVWDSFLKQRATAVKPGSLNLYRRNREIFFETFPPNDSIEKITADDLLEWKSALLVRYAPTSVAGYIGVAKMVFDWAVDQDWLTKNPLKSIPAGSFRNRENDRIITMDEYGKLLDACPNQEWRTIIALARIGGLRCPSELRQLRWSDINWQENRFVVRSPKTEQYEGQDKRVVPLFPELRTELERLHTEESEFVIEGFRRTSWNLNDPLQGIARRAGLGVIVRPFDNMRMSRSNEVLARWGQAKESLWIGHSAKVMQGHYLCLSDADFADAAKNTLVQFPK